MTTDHRTRTLADVRRDAARFRASHPIRADWTIDADGVPTCTRPTTPLLTATTGRWGADGPDVNG